MAGREKAGEVLIAFAGEAEDGELGNGESLQREAFQSGADNGSNAVFLCSVMSTGGTVESHVIDEAD